MSCWDWAWAFSPRWRSMRNAMRRCARSTRAISSNRAPPAWASSAAPICAATHTSSSNFSRRTCRARSSSARLPARKARATSYELAHLRKHHFAPAPAGEDAVVPDARRDIVAAPLARNVEAERMRCLGLTITGNIVELALDGEECARGDRLRPHQLLAHPHAPLRHSV